MASAQCSTSFHTNSSPSITSGLDYLVVHGRQHCKFPLTKGLFPNGRANLKEEAASRKKKKEKSKPASNIQTPAFLWDIEISPQLENCATKTKEQEIDEYIKFSAQPLQAMFQIGRSKDSFIDFYFTKPFNLKKNEFHSQPGSSNNLNADGELQDGSNTSYTNEDGDLRRRCQNNSETEEEVFDRICRYACQISVRLSEIVDPDGSIHYSRETKIFAGGIDSRNTFRLGDPNRIWFTKDRLSGLKTFDGFTSNPLLILSTLRKKLRFGIASQVKIPKQVSVQGHLYDSNLVNGKNIHVPNIHPEENVLVDGTMIFFVGGSLVWRSSDGISQGPTDEEIQKHVQQWNHRNFQCPVKKSSLILALNENEHQRYEVFEESDEDQDILSTDTGSNSSRASSSSTPENEQSGTGNINDYPEEKKARIDQKSLAYVNTKCGHIQSKHPRNYDMPIINQKECYVCKRIGNMTSLKMGFESAFWVDKEPPTHIFTPCGHMASETTVRYWLSVPIPKSGKEFSTLCPFCGTQVIEGGILKIKF